MPAQAADAEGNDGGEADRLEKERDHEHGEAGVADDVDGGGIEGDDAREVGEEDPARLDEAHQHGAREAADGEAALGAGEEVGACG